MNIRLKHVSLLSFSLTFVSIILHWAIPDDAGLATIAYFMFYASIIAVAGIVLLGILLFIQKTFRNLKNIFLLIFLFVLLPIFLGPILSITLLHSLHNYYESSFYRKNYLDNIGVTIEPQEKRVDYAYCKLHNYNAKYKITTEEDIDIIFSQVYKDGIEYANGLEKSISKYFELVGETYVRRGLVSTIGVFKVPKGTHIVELEAEQPFLLAMYNFKPLLTPKLFLLKEEDFPLLYADSFSMSDFQVASQTRKEQSCKSNVASMYSFINQYVYIPNAEINTHKGSDRELYLYNQWGLNSAPNASYLLSISEKDNISPSIEKEGVLYKTITNQYSNQKVNVFVTIPIRKRLYDSNEYLALNNHSDFLDKISKQDELTQEDLEYLHRARAYFWIDRSMQLEDIYLDFNDQIFPWDINKVVQIVETIERSKIFSKEVNL